MGDIPIAPSRMSGVLRLQCRCLSPSASQQTRKIGTGATPVFDVIQKGVIP